MFAVIKTGGKQYRVAPKDIIEIEKLDAAKGDVVELGEVLMIGDDAKSQIGTPFIDGASVAAEVVEQARGDKVLVFKKKRRKGYRRTAGHRQLHTVLKITEILTGGKTPSKAKAETKADAKPKATETPKVSAPKASGKSEAAAKAKPSGDTALFDAPAGKADDLKKISGVGPALEKKLNALGLTTYAQIADLSKDDIAKVDDALSFKGRIERDDWMSQAKALAKGA